MDVREQVLETVAGERREGTGNSYNSEEIKKAKEKEQHLNTMLNPYPTDKLTEVMEIAERQVYQLVDNIEAKLAKRESAAIQAMKTLESKRPKRITLFFGRSKAMRHWQKAYEKHKNALATVRRRQAALKAIKHRQTSYKALIAKWTYNRALKNDFDVIQEHEKVLERIRREEEQKRREKTKELAFVRELSRQADRTHGITLERSIAPK